MGKLKFGWSEKRLLPEGAKVSLAGQFYERISAEEESPLTVTALAVEDGTDAVIFCSCDLISVGSALLQSVRDLLKSRVDIPSEKLILSAIHCHTGLVYARRSDALSSGLRLVDILKQIDSRVYYEDLVSCDDATLFAGEEAHAYLAERIAEAVCEAWDARQKGAYATGFGRAAVGMCRRVVYRDGSARMWGDTALSDFEELESGNDSGIELLFTYTPDRRLTGVVANVACPAQVLEHRSIISSDYWGKVKARLRAKFGADLFVLALCSAAGDQCPRDMIRWVEPETPVNDPNMVHEKPIERTADPSMFDLKGCELVGRRIADEICYAVEEVDTFFDESVLEHRAQTVKMPLRRVSEEEKERAEASIRAFLAEHGTRINYKDSALLHVHAGTLSRYEVQQMQSDVEIELHFLRLGNCAFATNPYELFLNYGNRIRAASRARQTFLIQLACGALGYLPTRRAEKGSHYSAYVSSGTAGHEGGEILVQKTVREINDMF